MTTTAIATLIAQFGYPIALSIVLIWFLWHIHNQAVEREKRLGSRIDTLEDTHRDELVEVIKKQTQAQTEATGEQKRQNRNLEKLVGLMEKQPCLVAALEPRAGALPRPSDRTGETTRTHMTPG